VLDWANRLVVLALKKDHRTGEPVDMIDRRALVIERSCLRQGSDQPVEIAGLEFVGVLGEQHEIADAVKTRSRLE